MRQNICVPFLDAAVTQSGDGASLAGSFSLHPFTVWPMVVSLLVLGPAWVLSDRAPGTLAFLIVMTIAFAIVDAGFIREFLRLLPKERNDIVEFLVELFPESRR